MDFDQIKKIAEDKAVELMKEADDFEVEVEVDFGNHLPDAFEKAIEGKLDLEQYMFDLGNNDELYSWVTDSIKQIFNFLDSESIEYSEHEDDLDSHLHDFISMHQECPHEEIKLTGDSRVVMSFNGGGEWADVEGYFELAKILGIHPGMLMERAGGHIDSVGVVEFLAEDATPAHFNTPEDSTEDLSRVSNANDIKELFEGAYRSVSHMGLIFNCDINTIININNAVENGEDVILSVRGARIFEQDFVNGAGGYSSEKSVEIRLSDIRKLATLSCFDDRSKRYSINETSGWPCDSSSVSILPGKDPNISIKAHYEHKIIKALMNKKEDEVATSLYEYADTLNLFPEVAGSICIGNHNLMHYASMIHDDEARLSMVKLLARLECNPSVCQPFVEMLPEESSGSVEYFYENGISIDIKNLDEFKEYYKAGKTGVWFDGKYFDLKDIIREEESRRLFISEIMAEELSKKGISSQKRANIRL